MTFLRPWLLLLAFIPLVFRLFHERVSSSSDWHKVIDKALLPYLLVRGRSASAARRSLYQTLLWVLLSVAAAGPAWYKIPMPARAQQPGTVIILDLGETMTGEWLAQAQRKIQDILSILKGEQVGLVLYDTYGYTAGPLTVDTDIIRDMVPYLNADLLPEKNANPAAGFAQADKLLKNAGITSGRILFLTSGGYIPDDLADIVKKYDHKIGILGIGPKEPRPIPLPTGGFLTDTANRLVLVQLNPTELSRLGVYRRITSDDSDIQTLLAQTEPELPESGYEIIDTTPLWQDMGGWFVLAALPLFALLFRKGLVLVLVLGICGAAHAGWWERVDQEAYRQQMYAYRIARYAQAEKGFSAGKNIDDLYNRGNALAFQQKIPEAIEAYRRVLEQDPNHEDARYNKEYLERQLQNPPEQNPPPESQDQTPPEQNPQSENQSQDNSDASDSKSEENPQNNDTEPENPTQPDSPQNPSNPDIQPPSDEEDTSQSEEARPEDFLGNASDPDNDTESGQPISADNSNPFSEDEKKLLNRLPKEEYNVLRYRIRQQYLRYRGN